MDDSEFEISSLAEAERQYAGGTETEWLFAGELEVCSGSVAFADACSPHEGKEFRIPAGRYKLHYKEYHHQGVRWFSRARISASDTYDYDCNEKSYAVDSASMCIADAKLIDRAQKKIDHETYMTDINRLLEWRKPGFFAWSDPNHTIMWAIETGFGDGLYDVFSLRNGDTLVGFETIFIGKDPPTRRPRPQSYLP